MKPLIKFGIVILIIFTLIFSSIFGIYWWRTEIIINDSPTGEYCIKSYWTDVGAWGLRGKIYLVKKDSSIKSVG